jgi:hypothetical protein
LTSLLLVLPVPDGSGGTVRERRPLHLVAIVGLVLYLLALMAGAVIETPQLARESGSFVVHVGAFGLSQLFVFLLAPRWRDRLLWLVLLFLFGGLIEAVQHFLPWRSATAIDLLYNGIGLTLGFLGCLVLERFARWRGWLPFSQVRSCS